MHMFKKCAPPLPPPPRRGLVILYGLWLWLSTKRSRQKRKKNGKAYTLFSVCILYIYSFFYFLIISIPQGAIKKVSGEVLLKAEQKELMLYCYF